MSAAKNNVTVRVTLGEPFFARASTGIFSTTASSTSSSRQAALAAAAKFFEVSEGEIELSLTQHSFSTGGAHRTPEYYLAWPRRVQMRDAGKVLTLTKAGRAA